MIDTIWISIAGLIYVLGSALLNRWRGNGDEWSHTLKRIVVSAWLSFPFTVHAPVVFGLILIIGFAGFGWGMYFDFKVSDDYRETEVRWIDSILRKLRLSGSYNDLVGMSLRGLHFTIPVALYLSGAIMSAWPMIYAPLGLLMGPVYWGFWRSGVASPSVYSEYVWGGVLAGIYLMMMMEVTL